MKQQEEQQLEEKEGERAEVIVFFILLMSIGTLSSTNSQLVLGVMPRTETADSFACLTARTLPADSPQAGKGAEEEI